ncbi:10189_t:CDS:2, partial [Acaulospora colombiana]
FLEAVGQVENENKINLDLVFDEIPEIHKKIKKMNNNVDEILNAPQIPPGDLTDPYPPVTRGNVCKKMLRQKILVACKPIIIPDYPSREALKIKGQLAILKRLYPSNNIIKFHGITGGDRYEAKIANFYLSRDTSQMSHGIPNLATILAFEKFPYLGMDMPDIIDHVLAGKRETLDFPDGPQEIVDGFNNIIVALIKDLFSDFTMLVDLHGKNSSEIELITKSSNSQNPFTDIGMAPTVIDNGFG